MSYDIIKKIEIQDNKVVITAAANNVYPRHWCREECPSLTDIYQKQGQAGLDLKLMHIYETGEFQKGNNKYTRAQEVLHNFPEYKEFNWRGCGLGEEYEKINRNRNERTAEFDQLLLKALETRRPAGKYIVYKDYFGKAAFLRKITKAHIFWTADPAGAKRLRYLGQFEFLKKAYTGGDNFRICEVSQAQALAEKGFSPIAHTVDKK